ncbi:snf2 family atp-dependent chromatin-remodeling factor snf21 [Ophiostoma piceae UAMH 11346]|uniref:Snf2 family atp-dependent chromatin-remodeling factor snf21 n=1 Tax=Ophiostoma piceae (strain UAMH 11346) TaxID=1262450 RepID=S3C5Z5_OPHP1|nr:snf2 family atp-dependent chromatin-remodeling factor snf21 [Ophiostoma piceae UAMH 11346]
MSESSGDDVSNGDDPFKWSNERLIKELCTEDRTWKAPAPRKWPDPKHLASVLEEHELDGQDLLSYEDMMGRDEFETLCKDLEIKKIPHKTSIRMAIRLFQDRSPAYKAWKKVHEGANEDAFQTPKKPRPDGPDHATSPSPFHFYQNTGNKDRLGDLEKNSNTPMVAVPFTIPRISQPQPTPARGNTTSPRSAVKKPTQGDISHGNDQGVADAMDIDVIEFQEDQLADASKKRKRLAPINISVAPRSHSGHVIDSTDAETATTTYNPLLDSVSDRLWQDSGKGAYLGHWKLTMEDILQGPDPLDASANDDDFDTDGFGWAKRAAIPAGRRFQVDRIMRRFLKPSRASLPKLGRYQPENAPGSGVSGGNSVGASFLASTGAEDMVDDEVLPALGESDDEGYDTETWEAMEQEEQERQNQQMKSQLHLPRETVDMIIADAIRVIEAKWAAKKLHKLRRQAYQLWKAARRTGSQRFKMDMADREAERYGQRINKLVEEIRQVEWKNDAEIRRQASVLEASVEDRQLALWEAKLYSQPSAPPKVAVERPFRPKQWSEMRTVRTKAIEGDEEVLTSSSDEDDHNNRSLGGFIVDDEKPTTSEGGNENDDDDNDDDDDDIIDDGLSPMVRPVPVLISAEQRKSSIPTPEQMHSPELRNSRHASSAEPPSVALHSQDIAAIALQGAAHFEAAGDVTRLLCALFYDASQEQMVRLFNNLILDDEAIWQKYCVPVLDRAPDCQMDEPMGDDDEPVPEEKPEDDGTLFTRFFNIFLLCRNISPNDFEPSKADTKKEILDNRGRLGSFCVKMRTIAPYLGYERQTDKGKGKEPQMMAVSPVPATNSSTIAMRPSVELVPTPTVTAASTPGPGPEAEESILSPTIEASSSDFDAIQVVETESDSQLMSMDESLDEMNDEQVSPSKRRKRTVLRDKGAQDLRDKDKARHENLETRRKALYQNLEQSGTMTRDQARLIINLAKDDHHGFVYVNPWISRNIRDHQIEGVRFMWNQIITPSGSRQGCLLAHTMGLGKTMQVITLLVAIAEAARSPDSSISSQIPEDLRESKTLILCPSGLVENWLDEIMAWAQDGILGTSYHISSAMSHTTRRNMVEAWAENGGIMVLGYPMFGKLLDDFDDVETLMQNTPNIVIADEAHALKNPKSKVHRITSHFRTSARIAMTGSPLANSVDEYHSMINWVAPNYLADHREFVSVYANPIKEGFYRDSLVSQKRHAYKMLKILKDTVAPKIHRATVASLKGELPDKREFILYLPLTDIQLSVYKAFMSVLQHHSTLEGITTTVQLWNFMLNVSLLLAHPKVLQTRLEQMKRGFGSPHDAYARKASLPEPVVNELLHALKVATRNESVSRTTNATTLAHNLNHIAYSSKMTVLSGILDEARRVNEKVLVFSQSRNVLDYLDSEFRRQNRKFSRLDGDTAVQKRQAMVKEFNAGSDEVYLISTTAGGVGLNIQGANRVVIFDFRWNPMHEQQAIGRAFRIGQRKNVYVYWLIVDGTYETLLHDQAVFKTQLASRVVDKKNPSAWADQMRNYAKDPVQVPINKHLEAEFRGRDPVLDALLTDGSPSKSHIARIVSTDTFEQEEPEATLTAEELNEAAVMVIMNKRRLKLGGLSGAMAVAAAGDVEVAATAAHMMHPVDRMQVDGAGFMPPAAASTTQFPIALDTSRFPSTSHHAPAITHPFTPPPAQQLLVPRTVPLHSSLPPRSVQAPPSAFIPMQIPTQSTTTNVAPTLRAESRDGNKAGQSAGARPPSLSSTHPTPPTTSASSPVPRPTATPKPAAVVSQYISGLMGSASDLRDEITRRLASGAVATQRKPSMHIAACIADVVVDSIKRHFTLSGLPGSSQWARLKHGVATNLMFLEALVYGIIDPMMLATMTHAEETRYMSRLEIAMRDLDAYLEGQRYSSEDPRVLSHSRSLFGNYVVLERVLLMKMLEGATPSFSNHQGDFSKSHAMALTVVSHIKQAYHLNVPVDRPSNAEAEKEYLARYVRRAFRDGIFANLLLSGQISHPTWLRLSYTAEAELVAGLHKQIQNQPTQQSAGAKAKSNGAASNNTPGRAAGSASNTPNFHRPASAQSSPKMERRDSLGVNIQDITTKSSTAARKPPSRDPDHARENLQRSQARVQLSGGDLSRASTNGATPSRDILAMREVIKRRARKEGRPSQGGPASPSPPSQSLAGSSHTSQSQGSPAPVQIPPPAKTKAQTTRDLLEADRRQQLYRQQQQQQQQQQPSHGTSATKPRILPPSSQGPGNNAKDPFVLD